MKGTFYYRYNPETQDTTCANMQEFDKAFFLKLLEGPKKQKAIKKIEKDKFEEQYYILTHYYNEPDGSIILFGEQRYTETINIGSFINHYKNIAIIKLDQVGKIIWSTKIGKNNSIGASILYPDPGYSSFITVRWEDNIFVLYNGSIENLNHQAGKPVPAFRDGAAFINARVLNNGEYHRSVLLTKKQLGNFRIRPGLNMWSDPNTKVLFGQDPDNVKNQRFMKLRFDQD